MTKDGAAPVRWTLIRGARQLLTLHGEPGPRRGRLMNKLEIIPNGAVLLRNGAIECVGPAHRVENLAPARKAAEIHAGGRVVMPAFVEADATALHDGPRDSSVDMAHNLRTSSRKKLSWVGIANLGEYARQGILTAGLPSSFAGDLKTLLKVLKVQQSLQSKPLRLRSIARPFLEVEEHGTDSEHAAVKWLHAVKERRLAAIVELDVPAANESMLHAIRSVAFGAASAGLALRLRGGEGAGVACLELARDAGAISSIIRPDASVAARPDLLRGAAVITVGAETAAPCRCGGDEMDHVRPLRALIEADCAIALSMGACNDGCFTRNMQHTLYVAHKHLGLTLEEAITAATINAAHSLRAAHVTGSLEPGKSADLLVMDVTDYRDLVRRPGTSSVEMAIRAGHVVYRRSPLILD